MLIVLVSMIFMSFMYYSVDVLLALLSISILIVALNNYNYQMFGLLVSDYCSMSMVMMTMWIMMGVYLVVMNTPHKVNFVSCISIVMISFFCSDDMILMFIMFEISLIPIFILVMGEGVSPERLTASMWMMMYTMVGSVPLLMIIIYFLSKSGVSSLSMLNYSIMTSYLFTEDYYFIYCFLMAFLIKVPLFFLHSWLPKAHVESPLEGSMILAGIMLKMGVYGIIRVMFLFPWIPNSYPGMLLLTISIIGSVFTSWLSVSVSDVKMGVAFSSVSHMNFLLSSLFLAKCMSVTSSIFIMISHGLCSSMLFYIVTHMYHSSNYRNILFMKGINSVFPILTFISFVNWCFNLSAPPSISFMGEMLGFISMTSISIVLSIMSCVYILAGSFQSLFSYVIGNHSFMEECHKSAGPDIRILVCCLHMMLPLIMMFMFTSFLL
uniref:NADH dehydrogenase subunit 4 n=1 Tax=Docophoroides brevis TaxID=160119 RepID=UPI00211EDAF8|nr:NADH dehydrogenase subunit 4 [Docophoroides brevis]UTT72586.1 NADH dehydrogenase subunit 4 [Docophoroides brevis]